MISDFTRLINPFNSLAARIGWIFGVLSMLSALLIGQIVGGISRRAVEHDIGQLYADRAEHVLGEIDFKINSDLASLKTAASVLGADGLTDNEQSKIIVDAVHANLDGEVWVGVADLTGKIIAGDTDQFSNVRVIDRRWFTSSTENAIISVSEDLPKNILIAKSVDGLKFIVQAAPIKDGGGVSSGVAIAFVDMSWIKKIWTEVNNANKKQVDLYLYSREGNLIFTSAANHTEKENLIDPQIGSAIIGAHNVDLKDFFVTSYYLTGYAAKLDASEIGGSGITAVVRESLSTAYQSAAATSHLIFYWCLALGLGLSMAAAFATSLATMRLAKIAVAASNLQKGAAKEFVSLKGTDEAARISKSLAELFNQLKQSNSNLEDLNQTLDQKVVDRTREVQRLSEETRSAAITRDRLRMSRDLHDTLAHSMLAMLTQIRLMKKLHKVKPELLKDELELAEEAAQEGLNKARDAVTELRYFAVRDDGLEPALRKLLARLKERVEINTSLYIDAAAASLAGPKAETLFRVAEEALHNVEKHAKAQNVSVAVRYVEHVDADHELSLIVEDDGVGFDVSKDKLGHFGLLGMREQAALISAKLEISSSENNGTRVKLHIGV